MAITIYGLDETLRFGKHEGKVLNDVIEDDPSWVRWAVSNVKWFDISQAAEELLIETEADAEIEAEDFADWGDRF